MAVPEVSENETAIVYNDGCTEEKSVPALTSSNGDDRKLS